MEDVRPLNQLVYVPDHKDGYVLGRIVDLDTKNVTVRIERSHNVEVKTTFKEVLPAVEDQEKDVNDNCSLMYLNEGTLLHNCRLRYSHKRIYTYVANILISINPYQQLEGLYSSKTIEEYRGKSLGIVPPHIFAIADKAYRELKRNNESQSIIVSGESGAGKTECQKCVLRYLCENFSSTEETNPIEKLILETNPILEAFGSAKTLRNNNSSRFGKFVEIHFAKKHEVVGGFVSHYLLEKSRIISQSSGERNYHVFYQMIAGTDKELADKLGLTTPDNFKYLNQGFTQFFGRDSKNKPPVKRLSSQCKKNGLIFDEMVDDFTDFHRLCSALTNIGIEEKQQSELFRILAGILHLGNIEFVSDDVRGGCSIIPESKSSLIKASELLGLEIQELQIGLTARFMQPTRSGALGTLIQIRLKPAEARSATDALSKAIYNRLFDKIVSTINSRIPFGNSENYIGVLDIAGFEFFKSNSFEQLCINYCNEKLQKFFNDRILKQEQELYTIEGLNVPRIEYNDNQDCIELFENKGTGLLELLNEEARLPRPSVQHFTSSIHQKNKNNKRLLASRTVKEYRDLPEDQCFIVRHYAADVCYQTPAFLDKNNDSLHASLEELMENSANSFITQLFNSETNPLAGTSSIHVKGKLSAVTVSSKFRTQLNVLIQKLETTGTHFVRCIKPNTTMEADKFDGATILCQLRSAGMANVLCLMQMGYPSRTAFADLYNTYKKVSSGQLSRLDPRLFCKCIFHALGLNDMDFKFGVTKVFFRSGKFAEFDQLLRHDVSNIDELVKKAQSWLNCIRWKKAQYCALACIKIRMLFEARREARRLEESRRLEEARRLEEVRLAKELADRLAMEKEAEKLTAQKALADRLAMGKEDEKIAIQKALEAQKSKENEPTSSKPNLDDAYSIYNVASWSYAKLRDTINTETAIALIEACLAEFHNRLDAYRKFKLDNSKYKHSPQ